MKIEKNVRKENFGHKKFGFRIDEKHQQKAIMALINLYQHKIRTPVQEVISNARDAHREVGKPDHTFKVEVTDTHFTVRDYGSGIDPEKAQNIFCSIGESTKTNDNTQTGGFGIGAKSPLAYTGQFEVISYVKGTKYHYIIAKNGDMLDMNLVSEESTKVVDGTKVIIPVKTREGFYGRKVSDKDNFINAVKRCCYFWEKRPEFNHDIEPLELFKLKGLPNHAYYKTSVVNGNTAVIDGIPYNVGSGNKVVFYNTGDLRVHETRERLNDTPEDKEYNYNKVKKDLELITSNINDNFDYYVNNNIKGIEKLVEFNISFQKYLGDMKFITRTIRGVTWNDKFVVYEASTGERSPYNWRIIKRKNTHMSYKTEFYYNNDNESIQKVSRRVRGYLKSFLDNKEVKIVHVVDCKTQAKFLNAKDITTLEMPKPNRSGVKKETGEITITKLTRYGQDRYNYNLETIVSNWLYVDYKQEVCDVIRRFAEQKGYSVCKLSKDSIDRVQNHEKFTSFKKWVDSYKLTKEEENSVYARNVRIPSAYINFTEVLDPKIKTMGENIRRYKYDSCGYNVPTSFVTKKMNDHVAKIVANNAEINATSIYMEKEYPLMGRDNKENTEYLNALYSYRKNLHTTK